MRTERNHEQETPWFTSAQAAAYLGVKLGTVRNWISQKRIPFVRRGRVVRLHRERLDEWLRAGACPERNTAKDAHRQRSGIVREGGED